MARLVSHRECLRLFFFSRDCALTIWVLEGIRAFVSFVFISVPLSLKEFSLQPCAPPSPPPLFFLPCSGIRKELREPALLRNRCERPRPAGLLPGQRVSSQLEPEIGSVDCPSRGELTHFRVIIYASRYLSDCPCRGELVPRALCVIIYVSRHLFETWV